MLYKGLKNINVCFILAKRIYHVNSANPSSLAQRMKVLITTIIIYKYNPIYKFVYAKRK